ncbi:uncharacterized protein LOC109793278 isoform X1 [Cajanus cajan]|uniref:uncharacterized protein LOC109793278 isoform X1 n=1 Tax=Cajanus cajan TaxID=3821 RepID=UPI00098D8902|nr:uncharacterized protein LOC109793278 isoform X1 [Cajanus cajan]
MASLWLRWTVGYVEGRRKWLQRETKKGGGWLPPLEIVSDGGARFVTVRHSKGSRKRLKADDAATKNCLRWRRMVVHGDTRDGRKLPPTAVHDGVHGKHRFSDTQFRPGGIQTKK